jgi:hypothetical protein
MTALNNPGLAGDLPFDTVIYASALLKLPAGIGTIQTFRKSRPSLRHRADQHIGIRTSRHGAMAVYQPQCAP